MSDLTTAYKVSVNRSGVRRVDSTHYELDFIYEIKRNVTVKDKGVITLVWDITRNIDLLKTELTLAIKDRINICLELDIVKGDPRVDKMIKSVEDKANELANKYAYVPVPDTPVTVDDKSKVK